MSSASNLRFVLVTPEKTLFDEPVEALRFPLFDGQIGILPSRAPMVGRLGYGELKITSSGGEQSYFIDGGFAQVKGAVVTILTNRALTRDEIDVEEAEQLLEQSQSQVATNDVQIANRDRDQERARRMLSIARG